MSLLFCFSLTVDYFPLTFLNAVRKAVFTMMAMKRMSTLASLSPGAEDFNRNLQKYKEESEKVRPLVVRPRPSHPLIFSAHRKRWMRTTMLSTILALMTMARKLMRYSLPKSLSCPLTASQRPTELTQQPANSLFLPILSFVPLVPIFRSFYSVSLFL